MLLPQLLAPDAVTAHLRRPRPTAAQLAEFKGHLAELLKHLDPTKIERHGETHILDFLRLVTRPLEGGNRYGNVNGKRDLVLRHGRYARGRGAGGEGAKGDAGLRRPQPQGHAATATWPATPATRLLSPSAMPFRRC